MTTIQINKIKKRIASVLKRHASVSPSRSRGLLRIKDLRGKLYEAEVLSIVIENLVTVEGMQVVLMGRARLELKVSGGPIDRTYPYFLVYRNGAPFGEIFTDTYFSTLSSNLRIPGPQLYGDYHELDITLVEPGVAGRPEPHQIMLAIECKNTPLQKSIIRELLGFRRELSTLQPPVPTPFVSWPANMVPANPPSIHMLFIKNAPGIIQFQENCKVYGTILVST